MKMIDNQQVKRLLYLCVQCKLLIVNLLPSPPPPNCIVGKLGFTHLWKSEKLYSIFLHVHRMLFLLPKNQILQCKIV